MILDLLFDGKRAVGDDPEYFTPDDRVWFQQPHEPGTSFARSVGVAMDRSSWEHLGKPHRLSVEPLTHPDPENFRGTGVPIGEPLRKQST
jgi:hypothetical protein